MACDSSSCGTAWAQRNISFEYASELDALLVQPSCARTPTVTYLGVSPPVRSGAANPWARDRSWTRSAYSASHSNLQALRELDSTGESFLRAGRCCGAAAAAVPAPAPRSNVDAASLVLASPDLINGALSDAPGADEDRQDLGAEGGAGAGCCGFGCRDQERLSDAGSESTEAAAPLPREAAAGPAALAPRTGLLGRPPLFPAAAPEPRAEVSLLRPAAAAPGPAQATRAPCSSKPAALEPFACHTQYYV